MALKTTKAKGMPRNSYGTNVKSFPLNQNGLEAQYQGLDIREVNIDHAGLAILGRGGSQYDGMRNIVKTKRRYKVVLPKKNIYPELTFEMTPNFANSATPVSLYADTNTRVRLTSSGGITKRYQYTSTEATGTVLPNGYTALLLDSVQNPLAHLKVLHNQILNDFPSGSFEIYVYAYGPQDSQKSRMRIVSTGSREINSLDFGCSAATILDDFQNLKESHVWALDGYTVQKPFPHAFYEDQRIDYIMASSYPTNPNAMNPDQLGRGTQISQGSIATSLPAGAPIVNLEGHLSGTIGSLLAATDPTSLAQGSTIDSEEIRIEQLPQRQKVFNTYEDNLQWREDIHYLHPDEQTWPKMKAKSDLYVESSDVIYYGSIFEQHIANMMDSNFADEQYIVSSPLSGRIDAFQRLSKHYGMHLDVLTERHQYSILDQYLEQSMDMVNIHRNTVPVADVQEGQLAFEDNKGKAETIDNLQDDYFDQRYVDAHDFEEADMYTRIDDEMLNAITPEYRDNFGNLRRIQRREWQEPNYIYTSTGFITSQVTGPEGIMFRDLKR